MANGKIELKLGSFTFSGEGDENWLTKQLDKILEKLNQLQKVAIIPSNSTNGGLDNSDSTLDLKNTTLASFLKSRNATSNQNKKFLATSIWLQSRGKNRISTMDVTKALKDNKQSKLGNASDCLSQNVAKGFCEKDGKEFYVTDEGLKS
jgi:NADH pyrophosphatase NudC (nudix superfamily)